MSDFLGSFLGSMWVRPEHAEKSCVGLLGQPMIMKEVKHYKWYQSLLLMFEKKVIYGEF